MAISIQTGYVSTKEAAKVLGISPVAVFKRIKTGQIKAIRIGRSYGVPESYLNEQIPSYKINEVEKKDYISVVEAGEILNVSRRTILNKIAKGEIAAKRVGGHYVIDRTEVTVSKSEEIHSDTFYSKEYFSIPELAEILSVSRIAVFKQVKKGKIKAKRVGRHYVIARSDIPDIGEGFQKKKIGAEQYISVMEAAETLGISRIVVFQNIQDKKIEAIKIGRSYAIKKHDFRSFCLGEGKN